MATSDKISTISDSREVHIQTGDNELYSIRESVITSQSIVIEDMLGDSDGSHVPLPNITSNEMPKIIEYCNWKYEADKQNITEDARTDWINNFTAMDQQMLFNVILGANYLGIQSLLDITCKAIADMMKGKTPEEIRETFNIVNDFTPEEEEEIRRDNSWCEDI
jgi:S-phase kinase-associated protein 1